MIQLFQLEMRKRLYLRKYLSQTGNIFSGLYPHMNQTFGRKKKFHPKFLNMGQDALCTVPGIFWVIYLEDYRAAMG